MDKSYIMLFKNLAQAMAASAEQLMEYEENSKEDSAAATVMRDDYQALADHITNDYQLSKSDAAKLLLSAMIQVNQTQGRIENLRKAMVGYQTDVIPKLQELVDLKNEEEISKLAEEKFKVKEK